ncbi:thioredoxin family protein [Planctomicrobium sp. SH664]|uniref:thioredoxin family protein n=1 Tax=Planctomicrobium sp. SH664 TaxID=3448125 RepID=UPI003F5C9A53
MTVKAGAAVLLTRADLDQMEGPVVVEFGAEHCPICQGFRPKFEKLLGRYPQVRHLRVEDGRGLPLGRSFHVKLWPTFVFMKDGELVQQSARPELEEARQGLEAITRAVEE